MQKFYNFFLAGHHLPQVLPASRRLINGDGFLLCSAALWAYHNSRTLLPDSLITRIEKFGADRLESKRVVVKADDDNFIDSMKNCTVQQNKVRNDSY